MQLEANEKSAALVLETIASMGEAVRVGLDAADVRIVALESSQHFRDVHTDMASFDNMPFALCQGVYRRSERLVVLKVVRPDIISHEILHHFDFEMGDGEKPRSLLDDRIGRSFRRHTRDGYLISNYAGASPLEFAAESLRASFGFSTPRPSSRATDFERLKRIDPELAILMESWREEIATRWGADAAVAS